MREIGTYAPDRTPGRHGLSSLRFIDNLLPPRRIDKLVRVVAPPKMTGFEPAAFPLRSTWSPRPLDRFSLTRA